MTSVYTFGGARVDGRANVINVNDRQFKCGFGVCEIDRSIPSTQVLNQSDLFNLDFELFDIGVLRENLSKVSSEVTTAYRNILNWFIELENSFATKIQLGDITMNISLFNKLNMIIPKFTSARKVMDSWYNDYVFMVSDLTDLLSDYSNSAAKLQSISTQNVMINGSAISENVITMARQNLARSRAIQRAITRIISLDAKIRSSLQSITFKLNELATGVLRYDENKILNLIDLSNAISNLSDSESPLVQIQTQLSNIVNTTPLNFILRTKPPELLPSVNYDPSTVYKVNTMPPEKVIEKLQAFKEITMYTTTTKPIIDSLQRYVDDNFKNDVQYEVMTDLINRIITENAPLIFMDTLNSRAADPNEIYLTIDIITRAIRRLNEADSIYRERLTQILNTANETAQSLRADFEVTPRSDDSGMDVDRENVNEEA